MPRRSIYELLIAFEAGESLTLDERLRLKHGWHLADPGHEFQWQTRRRRVTFEDPNSLDVDSPDLATEIIRLGKQCDRVGQWVARATGGKPSRETIDLLSVVNLLLQQTTELAARLAGLKERRRLASRQGGQTSAQSRRARRTDGVEQLRAAIEKRRQDKPSSLKAAIIAELRDTRPDWLTLTNVERQRAVETVARRLRKKIADRK